MPSTGTLASHTACGARSSASSYVLAWLPDRMMPLAPNERMNSSDTSLGWISQYTCASRTRRAISCVTWEPKSRMRILSCMAAKAGGKLDSGLRDRRAGGVGMEPAEVEQRHGHRAQLQQR